MLFLIVRPNSNGCCNSIIARIVFSLSMSLCLGASSAVILRTRAASSDLSMTVYGNAADE